jgi:hypothetical protein
MERKARISLTFTLALAMGCTAAEPPVAPEIQAEVDALRAVSGAGRAIFGAALTVADFDGDGAADDSISSLLVMTSNLTPAALCTAFSNGTLFDSDGGLTEVIEVDVWIERAEFDSAGAPFAPNEEITSNGGIIDFVGGEIVVLDGGVGVLTTGMIKHAGRTTVFGGFEGESTIEENGSTFSGVTHDRISILDIDGDGLPETENLNIPFTLDIRDAVPCDFISEFLEFANQSLAQ